MDLNKLAKEIHQQNLEMGWWDGENPCIYEKMKLISTEIAEASEGARKDLMDDHLPHRKMEEVELADALIRTLDLGAYLGLSYNGQCAHEIPKQFETVGSHHLFLSSLLADFAESIIRGCDSLIEHSYSTLCAMIVKVSEMHGHDIEPAVFEKIKYNRTRTDHQKKNRDAQGGKKF